MAQNELYQREVQGVFHLVIRLVAEVRVVAEMSVEGKTYADAAAFLNKMETEDLRGRPTMSGPNSVILVMCGLNPGFVTTGWVP